MICIRDGLHRESTGVEARSDAERRNPNLNNSARVMLENYKNGKLQAALVQYSYQDVTVAEVLHEQLADIERGVPGSGGEAGGLREFRLRRGRGRDGRRCRRCRTGRGPLQVLCRHAERLIECFGNRRLGDFEKGGGYEYERFRAGRRIKSQSSKPVSGLLRFANRATAGQELAFLRRALKHFCLKHHVPLIGFDMPPLPDKTVVWLVWDQLIRLLLAARGGKFDEQGRRLHKTVILEDGTVETVWDRADADEIEEFEPVERFIYLYFYSGTRNANNRGLTWSFGKNGSISSSLNMLNRAGIGATTSHKRKETSSMLGTLAKLHPVWERADLAEGFDNVIHDRDGNRFSKHRMLALFKRAACNAGLPWVRPHHLKHSGVTLFTLAGLPLHELAIHFSTREYTLTDHYLHLDHIWRAPCSREFRPENLDLKALKKFSPKTRPQGTDDGAADGDA